MSFEYAGTRLKLQIFGQSHAEAVGAVLDGFPAGEAVDEAALARFMARRAPGKAAYVTQRREIDDAHILCGVLNGVTTGDPVCAVIANTGQKSADYDALRRVPRPSHADWPAFVRSGGHNDARGGGSSSGRLTAPLCFAGALCEQALARRGVRVYARLLSVGDVFDAPVDFARPDEEALARARDGAFPTVDDKAGAAMRAKIEEAAARGDSIGGRVECFILGLEPGLGSPMFDGVENRLARIVFAVPAVKGVEFGSGFEAAGLYGSQNNDGFIVEAGRVVTATNRHGGALGGMTSGMPVRLCAALKPTPSIARAQRSVDLETMEETQLAVSGRHDPCVAVRAAAAIEAAAAVAALDMVLEGR